MDKSWVTWTELNLQRGCDPKGIVDILLKEKFELSAIRNVMGSKFPEHCEQVGLQIREHLGPFSALMRKRESLVHIHRSLLALNPRTQVVERRRHLSRAEFLEQYYAVNRPVILCGLMDNWSALKKWTPSYLKSLCGDTMVEIQAGRNTTKLLCRNY